jgi:hypothetical protein
MQRITLQTGATLIEVITASAVGVLLLSVAVPVAHRVRLVGTTEQDAVQQQTIHAAMVRDSKGNPGERLPTPGLINRLPYNGQQVPGEGGEDYAQNKTQNLYSACIARGLFGPQILVGATEINPVVEAYTAYNYNAYRPDADSYWDPNMQAQIGGTAGSSSKSHTSFAHQLLCGLRKDVYWRGTADANRPLLCTRGTQNGVTTGDRYVRSPTLRLHGAPDSWEGNVCYGDNHVELATSFTPPRSSCACGTYNAGAVTPDNLFRCAGTTDATEFTGSGCVESSSTGALQTWSGMDAMLGIHPNSATRYIVIPAYDSLITP